MLRTSNFLDFTGISLDTEDSEYNAYLFYQLLEEQTSNAYTLVEDVKVTPQERAHDIEHWILNVQIPIFFHENEFICLKELKLSLSLWFSNENMLRANQNKQQIVWKFLGFVDSGIVVWCQS